MAENMTYRTMAMHLGVDTFVFRRAIWNYIDVIFGIRHDYDYKDIDELLLTTMGKFIKAADNSLKATMLPALERQLVGMRLIGMQSVGR